MQDKEKTKEQLLDELAELCQQNKELKASEIKRKLAAERIKKLSRLKEGLLSSGSLHEKLKQITNGVVEILHADFSRIWITKPGDLCDSGCMHGEIKEGPHVCHYRDRCLHLIASSGRYTHTDGKVHRRVPFACYKIGRVASGKDPKFITNDVTNDPRVHDHDWAKKLDLISFAGYRLLSEAGEPIGVLALFSKRVISPDEDALIEDMAHTAAQVIQTTTADEALRKTKDYLEQEVAKHERTEEQLRKALKEIETLKEQLQADYTYLREEIKLEHNFNEIIGVSNALKYVLFKIEQIANIDTTVLVLGETGTGKELVARAIHNMSPRKNRPLVKVDCATLPPNLIESELFGHEKGSFTGSQERTIGRFELAHGSTIFLDEIGELPLELQSKLLRVIQDGEFERIGSSSPVKVDVRIIAATNRNLENEIRKGNFRQDLWYRLNVFPITVPPLRQRVEDIPLLVNAFVNKFSKKIGKTIEKVTKDDMSILKNCSWPGNIRELQNVIERAVINTNGSVLCLTDKLEVSLDAEQTTNRKKSLKVVEHDCILNVLQQTKWKIEGKNGAAVILGLNPSTLRSRMRNLGIRRK
jgi:transcriptional regulator with GAF, ATPase, and Fis domain